MTVTNKYNCKLCQNLFTGTSTTRKGTHATGKVLTITEIAKQIRINVDSKPDHLDTKVVPLLMTPKHKHF